MMIFFFPNFKSKLYRSLGVKPEEEWLTKAMYKKTLKEGANIVALDKQVLVNVEFTCHTLHIVTPTRGGYLERV